MRNDFQQTTPVSSIAAKRGLAIGLAIFLLLVVTILSFELFEVNGASTYMVVQSPIDGTLTWSTTPGVKWQGFGTVTKYNMQSQYWFSAKNDLGNAIDQSIKVRFNDGGHANISGSFAWSLPSADSLLTLMHRKYQNQHNLEQMLVRTVTEKAVYMTGPIMSSKESYAERRNDLLQYISDQITNGVYKTTTREVKDKDPLSGQERTNKVVEVVINKDNNLPQREDLSPLALFGIRVTALSINNVEYDSQVEEQIKGQQQLTMQVQTARANAAAAEQDAITVAKRGEANAASAKWEQEVIKAMKVTEAQQELEVATLQTKQAAQYKQKKILEAEGDAEYKRKVMVADGALTQKINAAVEINKAYAAAIGAYQGNWVPTYVMGGGGKDAMGPSGIQQFLGLITAKVSRDLALDMSVKGSKGAAPDQN